MTVRSSLTPDNATIIERLELDPTLVIFRIRPDAAPPPGEPWFLPGQYVTIGADEVQRAYSIASEPGERRFLEFYIRLAREPMTVSPLTHRLWAMPVGARVHLGDKIAGRFTLERTSVPGDGRVRVLVGAGTGLAPFVSMVRHAERVGDGAGLSRMAVLHGVSHPHELAYRDELADAVSRFGLKYHPTVSRPEGHPEWTGLTGRVETLLEDGRLGSLELRPDRATVYVCGFRSTIAGSVRRLLGRGFIPEDRRMRRMLAVPETLPPSLFFEQYDSEPVFDPDDAELIASLRAALGT